MTRNSPIISFICIIIISIVFQTIYTNALVTTMINATTTNIQEQWLVYHSLSVYGPQELFNITNIPMVPEQPTLCQDNPIYNFTNHIVVAIRGDCSFFDKTVIAQKYNATGLVIGNLDDGPLISMGYDKTHNTTEITIPTIMIRHSPYKYILKMIQYASPYEWPPLNNPNIINPLAQFIDNDNSNSNNDNNNNNNDAKLWFPPPRRRIRIPLFPTDTSNTIHAVRSTARQDGSTPTLNNGIIGYNDLQTKNGIISVPIYGDDDEDSDTSSNSFGIDTTYNDDLMTGFPSSILSTLLGSSATSKLPFLQSPTVTTGSMIYSPTNFSIQKSQKSQNLQQQQQQQSSQLKAEPYDPTPDGPPFYFLLTIDERGESLYPYFPIEQLQLFLLALIIAPLTWMSFLFIRWLRLYWGFRCVEELVTNTASHLPICIFVQTNEQGEIIFDSGIGTGSNNLADVIEHQKQQQLQQQQLQQQQSNNNDATQAIQNASTLPIVDYGAVNNSSTDFTAALNAPSSSTSNLFTPNEGYNTKHKRNVVVAPTHELYEKLKSMPTVSHTYVSQSITSPIYNITQQNKHLTFKTPTKETKDTNTMSYHAINTQSISSVNEKTHLRVHSDICNICLDNFVTGDEVKTLGCYHVFHPACIDHLFNSRSAAATQNGTIVLDEQARQEQRRMYAMMYLHSNYDFDELGNPSSSTTTTNTDDANSNPANARQQQGHMGQSCPVCRRSILETARMNSIVQKKWWIKLFEWLCMCSCCCPTWRRQRRQQQRDIERNQTPVLIDVENEQTYNENTYRYSYEVQQRTQTSTVPTTTGSSSSSSSSSQSTTPQTSLRSTTRTSNNNTGGAATTHSNSNAYNPDSYSY